MIGLAPQNCLTAGYYNFQHSVLWGNPEMTRCWRKSNLSCWIHPAAQSTLGKQKLDLLVSEQSVDFQIKIDRPKFYTGEMKTPA